jgi:uncharacterized membrane protein
MASTGCVRRPSNIVVAICIGATIMVGMWLRIFDLEWKLYWHDEVHTSLKIAGYTTNLFINDIIQLPEIHPSDLIAKVSPAHPANLFEILSALPHDEPDHTPLYLIVLSGWGWLFGTSVMALRLFSVFLSLVALPAMYWLCRELFATRAISWCGVLLLATSPFHIRYAQEAREYSLWITLIMGSTASLLYAVRRPTVGSWAMYAVLTALALATSLLHPPVCVSHALYIVWRWLEAPRPRRIHREQLLFAVAQIGAALPMVPWWWQVVERRDDFIERLEWVTQTRSVWDMLRGWMRAVTFPFVALLQDWLYGIIPKTVAQAVTLLVLGMLIWAIIALWRRARRDRAILVLSLIAVPLLSMIVPDLLLGGTRSLIVRYMSPAWVGVLIAMAYQLGGGIRAEGFLGRFWTIGTVLLLLSALTSDFLIAQNRGAGRVFSSDDGNAAYQAAGTINASERPYIIVQRFLGSPTQLGDSIVLSRLLDDLTVYAASLDPSTALELSRQADVFLLQPSDEYRAEISRSAMLEAIVPEGLIVRVRPLDD